MAKNQSTITVKSKAANGFRRAGLAFTREGIELDPSKLKKAQLDAILSEPNLIVIGDVETDAAREKREAAEKAAVDKAAADQAKADKAATDKAAADQAKAEKAAADNAKPEKAAADQAKAGK